MNIKDKFYPFEDGDGYSVVMEWRLPGECFSHSFLAIAPDSCPVMVSLSPKEYFPEAPPRKWLDEWSIIKLSDHDITMWKCAGVLK